MLTNFLYYLVILPASHLPFRILYLLSDFLYLVIYRLIGYRRKVVLANIRRSFPEKSEREIKAIEKNFYHHLSDLVVESLKTFTISAEEANRRMKVRNPELIETFYRQGKSVVGVGGHNGNWELYAVACAMQIQHKVVALYTPIKNKFFEKKMRKSRSRYGLQMIPTVLAKEELPKVMNEPTIILFGIDQCPRKTQKAHWVNFLNQETGVQFGAEKYARDNNLPVIFGNIHKIKRGYYEVEYKLVCKNPAELEIGEILEKSTGYLEDVIKKEPEYWLWSHKRWKYSRAECIQETEG